MSTGSRVAMLALAAGFCLVTGSDAPEPGGASRPQATTLEAYGDVDRACREWTDGCAICSRRDNGMTGCSTPGIACQPSGQTCRQKADTEGLVQKPPSPK